MCTVCGCGTGETRIEGAANDHDHGHDHDHHQDHEHHHHGDHTHGPGGALHFGRGPARTHVAGMTQGRLVEIETSILAKNDALAANNRARLEAAGVIAINLVSSPGAGKTRLLVETLKALAGKVPLAVIEGDQETSNDAARIRETGAPALQINTGRGCHLDADMIRAALDHMTLPAGGFLFIENVGNLVCPAAFDLGEARRVVLASITEGEDKPLKYPDMFASADAMVATKLDLLPHLEFDLDALLANARKIRPRLDVLKTSATRAPGLDAWLAWLDGLRAQARAKAE